jgi:hypothetical protein
MKYSDEIQIRVALGLLGEDHKEFHDTKSGVIDKAIEKAVSRSCYKQNDKRRERDIERMLFF